MTLARLRKDRMMTVVNKAPRKGTMRTVKTPEQIDALKKKARGEGTRMGMRGQVLRDYVENRVAPYRR